MRDCVIFDIDGTLSNPSHRLHYVTGRPKNWDAFFAAMGDDGVQADVVRLCGLLWEYDTRIVIVSGRPDDYETTTKDWLKSHDVEFDAIYMRKAGDHRSDVVVKREILAQLRADGWNPWLVIDDRPAVVEMWREEGLTCLAMPYHEDTGEHAGELLLTLMVGPSGGGKTMFTLANFPWDGSTISSDNIRQQMFGDHTDQSDNARVFRAVHGIVKERMKHGLHTVIDATNLRRKDRLACVALAPNGARVRYIVCDRPLDDKLRDRGWRSEALIHKHDQMLKSQLKEILAGDGLEHVIVEDHRL